MTEVYGIKINPINSTSHGVADKDAGVLAKIPCIIHQQWKVSEVDDPIMQTCMESWKGLNSACEYKFWTDADIDVFVHAHFKDTIWPMWPMLNAIQRADAFRYLVVLQQGGYYADLDLELFTPIAQWGVPADVGLVVGYETARHFGEQERDDVHFSRVEQFEQFFFAAAPGHPVLRRAAEIMRMKFKWGIEQTVELSGPGTWSDAVHEFLYSGAAERGAAVFMQSRPAGTQHDALRYQPGLQLGSDGGKVWIWPAKKVSAPGYSTAGVTDEAIMMHHFLGTW
eukprot:CAMPEP_0168375406 /NCGR_PEP_ID=MMETSP0228-20121227/9795_1 /TAXON_ID=133427 /ORGANISM="Protoceratium reticulatum, Strain CCCM 535 (=CCMP 1889)" /LENGTH=281 /DNA_ID=CAMNT_0008388373 /DNA_START=124 /DNA_END=966 /DNA_ORIENTATION=+